jgi:uncharacterized SAM-binding protein YcdF (DUF218 family)
MMVLYALLIFMILTVITGIAVWWQGKGSAGEFRYLLVLGSKVNGTAPGKMLRDRIRAAGDFLQTHPDVTCIVSGYKSGKGKISEAECMRRELLAMGIAENRILLEPNASSTAENLQFTMSLIESKGGNRAEKIGVLSSEHHLLRARLLASRQGITCALLPAKTSNKRVFLVNFLREIPLLWYYILFYWRKQI